MVSKDSTLLRELIELYIYTKTLSLPGAFRQNEAMKKQIRKKKFSERKKMKNRKNLVPCENILMMMILKYINKQQKNPNNYNTTV